MSVHEPYIRRSLCMSLKGLSLRKPSLKKLTLKEPSPTESYIRRSLFINVGLF